MNKELLWNVYSWNLRSNLEKGAPSKCLYDQTKLKWAVGFHDRDPTRARSEHRDSPQDSFARTRQGKQKNTIKLGHSRPPSMVPYHYVRPGASLNLAGPRKASWLSIFLETPGCMQPGLAHLAAAAAGEQICFLNSRWARSLATPALPRRFIGLARAREWSC